MLTIQGLIDRPIGASFTQICHDEMEDFRGDFGLPVLSEADIETLTYLGSRFEIDFVNLSYCNQARSGRLAPPVLLAS